MKKKGLLAFLLFCLTFSTAAADPGDAAASRMTAEVMDFVGRTVGSSEVLSLNLTNVLILLLLKVSSL